MRRSFFLLFWFNFAITWFAALLTVLFDWRAGWMFPIAAGGAFFLIWRYDPEKFFREQATQQLDELRAAAFELTDRCLTDEGQCQLCGSKHGALLQYPFDYRLHGAYCQIPVMRSRLEQVPLCPDALLHEFIETPKEQE